MKFWGGEELGSPKVIFGQPNILIFCINVKYLEEERAFSQLDMKSDIVRRTNFFCNKESLFACWRKSGGTLKCYAVDCGKMNYFVFPVFCINCEIVLTLRAYVLV